jgi:hypothetical protein
MNETDLFEKLLKISSGSLNIKLEGENLNGNKLKISVSSRRGSISKTTLGQIIEITNKCNANLKLLSYGIIEINFPKGEK